MIVPKDEGDGALLESGAFVCVCVCIGGDATAMQRVH